MKTQLWKSTFLLAAVVGLIFSGSVHAQNFDTVFIQGSDGAGGTTNIDFRIDSFPGGTAGTTGPTFNSYYAIGINGDSVFSRFRILDTAPANALMIGSQGVGIGFGNFGGSGRRDAVEALHVVGGGTGDAYPQGQIQIENRPGSPAKNTMLDIINNGGTRIRLTNTAASTTDFNIETTNNTITGGNPNQTSFDIAIQTGGGSAGSIPFRIFDDALDKQMALWSGGVTIGRDPTTERLPAGSVPGKLEVYANEPGANVNATIISQVESPAQAIPRVPMSLENNEGTYFVLRDTSIVKNGEVSEWSFSNDDDVFRMGRTSFLPVNTNPQPAFSITSNGLFLFVLGNDIPFFIQPNGNAEAKGVMTAMSFNPVSDRNQKENFEEIDTAEILDKVVNLPITKWNYKADDEEAAHIGPMAQDFSAAFHLGNTDKRISTTDSDGIALAAIKGLNDKVDAKDKIIQRQAELIESQAQSIDELMDRMERLEAMVTPQNK